MTMERLCLALTARMKLRTRQVRRPSLDMQLPMNGEATSPAIGMAEKISPVFHSIKAFCSAIRGRKGAMTPNTKQKSTVEKKRLSTLLSAMLS